MHEEKKLTKRQLWRNNIEAVIILTVLLIIIGSVSIFSSSFVLSIDLADHPYSFLRKHLINLAIGLVLCVAFAKFNYHRLSGNLMVLATVGIIGTLIMVLVAGDVVNGARRWLSVGPIGFQPSEFAKLFGVILMANFIKHEMNLGHRLTLWNGRYLVYILIFLIIELEPDLGTAAIFITIPIIMLVLSGLSLRQVGQLAGLAALAVVGMVIYQPYRLERILVWFDPFAEATTSGFQTVQSIITIGSGQLAGMGLGEGLSKFDYLPEAHTDFAAAILAQEVGFIAIVLLVGLFAALGYFMLQVAVQARDLYGQLLVTGLAIYIVGQAMANLLMVSGVLPVVGVPLPFISYGGSSLIATLIAIGITLNVAIESEKVRLEKERRAKIEEQARNRRRPVRLPEGYQ